MHAASVGFQCPDDVAAGAKTVREPRTTFGGRVSGDTSKVTITLIAINVAVFLLVLLVVGERVAFESFGNLPGPVLLSDGSLAGVAQGEYYRLLTAAFLHAGIFHLAMNMFALASLGPVLESALGRTRFLALYFLSALGGSTLSFLLSDAGRLGVGASGAIFGLFGAYYIVVRRLGGETKQILILLAINLFITFTVPIIDELAHMGGLVIGALVAVALAYAPRGPRRSQLQAAACGATLVLLVIAIVGRQSMLAV